MKGKDNTPLSEDIIKIMENDKRKIPVGKLKSKFFNTEEQFDYDLERMKEAMESEQIEVPDFNSFEDFEKWIEDEGKEE